MDLRGSVGHDALLVQGCLANGQPQAAEYLASRGAPLSWALTGWQRSGHGAQYYDVVAQLVAAGAHVAPEVLNWDKVQLDADMKAALETRP